MLSASNLMTAGGVWLSPDIWNNLGNSIGQIGEGIMKIVNPIAIVAVIICAVLYIASQNPQTAERAKTWGLRILIGVVIANVATQIVEWAQTLA